MRIEHSQLELASQATAFSHRESRRQLSIERPPPPPPPRVEVDLSAEGQARAAAAPPAGCSRCDPEESADPHLKLLQTLIESLTGIRFHLFNASELQTQQQQTVEQQAEFSAEQQTARAASLHLEASEHYEEYHAFSFAAQGSVQTADGRTIALSMQLDMSYHYQSDSNVSLDIGPKRKDPLVLNLSNAGVKLAAQASAFDLDSDGKLDSIHFVAPGSAFLGLDRNGNGRLDNGKELFGPDSGNGYAELAALDDDHNDWIDENDAVFGRLKLWRNDGGGQLKAIDLKTAGIGALSLSHSATPFKLAGGDNEEQGRIVASGLYLQENGQAGSLQQIDLTV